MARVDLILKLNIRKDERTVAPVETGGHISYLFRVLTANFRQVFVTNIVYALIFALPLLFSAFVLPTLLQNIVMKGHSFIGNFGIGFPNVADSVTDALTQLAYYHRAILYPCIIGSVFIAFVGLSGVFYVARGLMWGEKVSIRSFFRGIKKHWARFMGVGACVTALTAAMTYGIGWHMSLLQMGEATPGSWITFILLILVGFVAVLLLGLLLPTFVCYRFSVKEALQNTCLLNGISIIPALLIAILAIGLMLLNLMGGLVSYLFLAIMLLMGFMFYALMYTDFAQFNFDAYIVPQVDPDHPERRRPVTVKRKEDKNKSGNPYSGKNAQSKKGSQSYGRYRATNKKSGKRRKK